MEENARSVVVGPIGVIPSAAGAAEALAQGLEESQRDCESHFHSIVFFCDPCVRIFFMRKQRFALAVAISLAAAASSSLADPRPLKPEDFAALREVDEPNISPDGNLIAYVVKIADMEKDKRPGNLWLAKWDGSEKRALTFGNKGAKHPRWSPDGKWIGFLSGREDDNENDQLWILPLGGGEAEKMTDAKGGVEDFAWAPDSKRIALVIHDPDPREPEKKEKEKKTVPPLVINRLFFKKDIEGYLTERYSHLQLLDLTTRKTEAITSGRHNEFWPAWSPDGKEIAFVTKRGADPDRDRNWDVWVIGAQPGAKERQVTTSPEADPDPEWDSAPAWSPDGKWIAFLHGGDPKKIEYAVHSLAIIPAAGGAAKVLTDKFDRTVAQPHWAPDGKSIFVTSEDDGAQNLVRVSVDGGTPMPVTSGRRKVTAYDVSRNGNVVVRASTPDRPYEIFAIENDKARDLTKQTEAFLKEVRIAHVDETKFNSADGTEIH